MLSPRIAYTNEMIVKVSGEAQQKLDSQLLDTANAWFNLTDYAIDVLKEVVPRWESYIKHGPNELDVRDKLFENR